MGRKNERGFGIIELSSDVLHLTVRQPRTIENHGKLITGERSIGKYVDNYKFVGMQFEILKAVTLSSGCYYTTTRFSRVGTIKKLVRERRSSRRLKIVVALNYGRFSSFKTGV